MEVLTYDKKVHVKTGDTVVVLSGKNKGKKARLWLLAQKKARLLLKTLTWFLNMLSLENG